ncbi:hypothetical protein [Vibrio barjaei]|uniref:hypothetical protein n=1 Tax=Vibrio barjaei TaxID=1676683 RepID=UPI0022845949|nr:hypothetical protein [Vibrio barjaei]MCY9874538.1 hypothetical protein [Vibrio barjaei]
MNLSSLQKRTAKTFAFSVDVKAILEMVRESGKSDDPSAKLVELLGVDLSVAKKVVKLPHSVIIMHALDSFYANQSVVKSVFADGDSAYKESFLTTYSQVLDIYEETVQLIGLNASIEQVLELDSSSIFKRRDWPKIRFIFFEEIKAIYKDHQDNKRIHLNKSEDEIQVEWNDHIKHSKGRKLSIADKVRIKNVMKKKKYDVSDLCKGEVLIDIAKEALVDIVQINQIF